MIRMIAASIICALLSIPTTADAKGRHHRHHHYAHSHHYHHHYAARHRQRHAQRHIAYRHKGEAATSVQTVAAPQTGTGIVSRTTLAGTIRVASAYADRFVGFINDLVHSGYKPRSIGCYSPTGHMRNSKHHWGGACDVDQTARNRTAHRMYHIGALAKAHGLTDGCVWRSPDCGHVEVPGSTTRMASLYRHRHVYLHVRWHHRHYARG